eukprot:11828702-Alexandrium_andersonii.AAC.1
MPKTALSKTAPAGGTPSSGSTPVAKLAGAAVVPKTPAWPKLPPTQPYWPRMPQAPPKNAAQAKE